MVASRRKRRPIKKPVATPATITVATNADPDVIVGKPKITIVKADNRIKVIKDEEEAE